MHKRRHTNAEPSSRIVNDLQCKSVAVDRGLEDLLGSQFVALTSERTFGTIA